MFIINSVFKEYSAIIAESIADIEAVRSEWEMIARNTKDFNYNVDIDHYVTVINNSEQFISPFVMILKKNDEACGIIVGRVQEHSINASIGYLTIFKKKTVCLIIIHGGVIIPQESIPGDIILNTLLEYTFSCNISCVLFNSLHCESPLMSAIDKAKFPDILKIQLKKQIHWTMEMPESMEVFYGRKSKKHKKNMMYYGNKLINDHSGQIIITKYDHKNDVDKMIKDAEFVAKKTYQRGMGVGFKDDTLSRSRMYLAANNKWLRSYILYIRGIPAAFQMGFQYKNMYFVQGKGYDPAFSDYRIGTYLFQQMLIDFCNDKTVRVWDFGLGDAEYKELYGTDKWDEQTCYIFAKKTTQIILFCIIKIINMINGVLEKITKHSGYYQKVKKRWRERFSSKKK